MSVNLQHWDNIAQALSISLVVICAITDAHRRRIPNVLTLPAVLAGLLIGLAGGGGKGLTVALLGTLAGFGLLLLPYVFGAMGAGDVKLMAAVGALLGFPAVIQVFLYTSIAGGVMAVVFIIHRRAVRRTFGNMYGVMLGFLPFVKGFSPHLARENSVGAMPYGIAIALGTIAYCVLGKVV